MTTDDKITLVFVLLLTAVLVTGMLVINHQLEGLKKQAIAHGFAQHNATTGEWQWKTNKATAVEFSIRLTD